MQFPQANPHILLKIQDTYVVCPFTELHSNMGPQSVYPSGATANDRRDPVTMETQLLSQLKPQIKVQSWERTYLATELCAYSLIKAGTNYKPPFLTGSLQYGWSVTEDSTLKTV